MHQRPIKQYPFYDTLKTSRTLFADFTQYYLQKYEKSFSFSLPDRLVTKGFNSFLRSKIREYPAHYPVLPVDFYLEKNADISRAVLLHHLRLLQSYHQTPRFLVVPTFRVEDNVYTAYATLVLPHACTLPNAQQGQEFLPIRFSFKHQKKQPLGSNLDTLQVEYYVNGDYQALSEIGTTDILVGYEVLGTHIKAFVCEYVKFLLTSFVSLYKLPLKAKLNHHFFYFTSRPRHYFVCELPPTFKHTTVVSLLDICTHANFISKPFSNNKFTELKRQKFSELSDIRQAVVGLQAEKYKQGFLLC